MKKNILLFLIGLVLMFVWVKYIVNYQDIILKTETQKSYMFFIPAIFFSSLHIFMRKYVFSERKILKSSMCFFIPLIIGMVFFVLNNEKNIWQSILLFLVAVSGFYVPLLIFEEPERKKTWLLF